VSLRAARARHALCIRVAAALHCGSRYDMAYLWVYICMTYVCVCARQLLFTEVRDTVTREQPKSHENSQGHTRTALFVAESRSLLVIPNVYIHTYIDTHKTHTHTKTLFLFAVLLTSVLVMKCSTHIYIHTHTHTHTHTQRRYTSSQSS
jgi:hypothetical protein